MDKPLSVRVGDMPYVVRVAAGNGVTAIDHQLHEIIVPACNASLILRAVSQAWMEWIRDYIYALTIEWWDFEHTLTATEDADAEMTEDEWCPIYACFRRLIRRGVKFDPGFVEEMEKGTHQLRCSLADSDADGNDWDEREPEEEGRDWNALEMFEGDDRWISERGDSAEELAHTGIAITTYRHGEPALRSAEKREAINKIVAVREGQWREKAEKASELSKAAFEANRAAEAAIQQIQSLEDELGNRRWRAV